jgi:hypothetical protein
MKKMILLTNFHISKNFKKQINKIKCLPIYLPNKEFYMPIQKSIKEINILDKII